jgi:hypothetical protein
VEAHPKVGIVDDRWLTLGSANLTTHSFFNDSAVNVVTGDASLARDTRLRRWVGHLERDVDAVAAAPGNVIAWCLRCHGDSIQPFGCDAGIGVGR